MGASYDNINGVWHKDSKIYDNIGGTWHPVKKTYDNISGVWHTSASMGGYLGVVFYGSSPFDLMFSRDGGTLTQLSSLSGFPSNAYAKYIKFSPDGNWLGVTFGNQNPNKGMMIYKRDGDAFIDTNTTLYDNCPYMNCKFSPDSQYLASIAYGSSTEFYLSIYKLSNGTWTHLVSPLNNVSHGINAVAWSPNGQYLAVSYNGYIYVYTHSGDTFTLSYTITAGSYPWGLCFDPTSSYIASIGSAGAYIYVYHFTGSQWQVCTNMSGTQQPPYNYNTDPVFTEDGYIAFAATGGLRLYSYTTSTFTFYGSAYSSGGSSIGVAISKDGKYFATSGGGYAVNMFSRVGLTSTLLSQNYPTDQNQYVFMDFLDL